MKKFRSYIYLMFGAMIIAGCSDDADDVSLVVKVGHPTITLIGAPAFSTAVVGGTYTDSGAVGFDDITGASVPLTPVLNEVDLSTPGFYRVKYDFSNNNGYVTYSTTKSRYVLVTTVDSIQDISGVYARTSNGQIANVVKIDRGLYTTDNVGGVLNNPSFVFPVYFGIISDTTIQVPLQVVPIGGELTCANTSLTLTPDTAFSWIVDHGNFAPSQRTFAKQ